MKYKQLLNSLSLLNKECLKKTAQTVHFFLTIRNWLIGQYIVEYEQNGDDRARYGDKLLKKLAKDMNRVVGRGFSERNLKHVRLFYQTYAIQEMGLSSSGNLSLLKLTSPKVLEDFFQILLAPSQREEVTCFVRLCQHLSWSHFVELIRLDDPLERQFYEVETLQNRWSVREMKRQIDSQLFARLCLSKDREKVLQQAIKGGAVETPEDLIKDPYVFEFLNLPEDRSFTESDLEKAIIDNLQDFLLEMGKGFCFVARQKRISFNTKHYRLDLLLFNRKLKALIAVDLKIGEFDHADAGQMNFYLSYLKKEEREEWENPPIGIILCASKEDSFVEYAFDGISHPLFVSKYQMFLPTKDELKGIIEKTKRGVSLSFIEKLEGVPSIPEKKLLSQPVVHLELSSRSRRCLKTLEIETIGDLLEKKPEELLSVRNFGARSLKEVKERLARFNLAFH